MQDAKVFEEVLRHRIRLDAIVASNEAAQLTLNTYDPNPISATTAVLAQLEAQTASQEARLLVEYNRLREESARGTTHEDLTNWIRDRRAASSALESENGRIAAGMDKDILLRIKVLNAEVAETRGSKPPMGPPNNAQDMLQWLKEHIAEATTRQTELLKAIEDADVKEHNQSVRDILKMRLKLQDDLIAIRTRAAAALKKLALGAQATELKTVEVIYQTTYARNVYLKRDIQAEYRALADEVSLLRNNPPKKIKAPPRNSASASANAASGSSSSSGFPKTIKKPSFTRAAGSAGSGSPQRKVVGVAASSKPKATVASTRRTRADSLSSLSSAGTGTGTDTDSEMDTDTDAYDGRGVGAGAGKGKDAGKRRADDAGMFLSPSKRPRREAAVAANAALTRKSSSPSLASISGKGKAAAASSSQRKGASTSTGAKDKDKGKGKAAAATARIPTPPAPFADWGDFFQSDDGLMDVAAAEARVSAGRDPREDLKRFRASYGSVVVMRPPCGICIKYDLPCLYVDPTQNPFSDGRPPRCIICQEWKYHCNPRHGDTKANVKIHAHTEAIAEYHNVAIAAGERPGIWMGPGVADLKHTGNGKASVRKRERDDE
ncbi:hypothetical protein HMN09_01084700 [Mycena chlorophos]|uniref:Uncharacterized protein n=1 Tax=Mycena chlorophos TaxID=658473 RepID=A0A8H6VZM7_MYCCL|nr:hypothetical protein HMN09_01084700 [Mycena chlorophos]